MRRILLASVLALPAFVANADETALPDRVVTATRIPTLAEQIPAGVTVIDRATIERRGYTTLVDALVTVPGLRVVQSGGPGGNASVFIRGTNSNHVLVLRDGVPVNDPSDPGGLFNFGVDTLGDIDRIEVVRGPMSSLYGSGAIGGVINLISRPGSGASHGTASLGIGLPNRLRGIADVQGATGRFDYNLGVETDSDRGFDTTPRRESVYTGARNGYRSQLGRIELGYTPTDGTRISALVRGRASVFGLDELGFPTYDARDYTGRDDNLFGRVGGTTTLLDGVVESSLFVSRNVNDRHYVEALEAADPNQGVGDSRYHGARTDLQWNNVVHLPDWRFTRETAATFGYERIWDSSRSRLDTVSSGFAYQSGLRASDTSDAGHAGLQTVVLGRLTLTGDVREESARYGGDAFTWRAGGVLAVPEILSRFKASYGTAFRAPSLYDLFGIDSTGYAGNPALRPERSRGWEAGWAIDLPALGRTDAATLDVTYFDNRIRDLIEFTYAPDFSSSTERNAARAQSHGVESSLTLRPASWVDTTLTWTYTEARDQSTGAALLRRPRNQITADATLRPLPRLRVTPELVYTSRFADYVIDDFGYTGPVERARSGVVLNLSAQYEVTSNVEAFAEGRNIGNSRFEPASGFQTPGPSVLAGVRTRF